MTFNCQRKGPKQDPPGRLSGDFRIHKLEKNGWRWGGKKEVSCKTVKCVLHMISRMKLETFVNSALFCFTKGLVLRNTIQ